MTGHVAPVFEPQGRPIDCGRPIRVTIIGAGLSGIALYIRLLQYVPTAQVTILEKNPEVGGTWYENRYPGVACDIPSHVYQYSFEPNTQWTKLFAPGAEILDYIQGVARKFGVDRKIKFNTKVTKADWNETSSTWKIEAEEAGPSGTLEAKLIVSEVVISAVGILNNWKWPNIDGLHDFRGKIIHSANWDPSWEYSGKTVALIGCGSSAIQILPHVQKKCPKVFNFVRGGTWISQPFGSTFTEKILRNSAEQGNHSYTENERSRFREDSEYYQSFRKEMESFINKDFPCLFPGSPEEIAGTRKIRDHMMQKLAPRPGVYEALEPRFTPGCRRLTPGPGYLEALTEPNVTLIKCPIVNVVKDGVVTADGRLWKTDAIVCATGFDCSHIPRFPVVGRNGCSMAHKWQKRAVAYLSHSVPDFPNYFTVGGPNSATGGGSLLLILESVMSYVVKAVQKISREHIVTMEVKETVLASWQQHLDTYFPSTVHVDDCTSWYKINGEIIGLWPGSSLHAMKALEYPKWEDYDYETSEGPYKWLGNGWTFEDTRRGNLGYYVDTVDIPPVPTEEILRRQL